MIGNKLKLIITLTIYYLLFPVFVGFQLYFNLLAGRYSPESDSIIIPFSVALLIWIIGFIPFGLILWAVCKTDLKDLSLFGFNRKRFAWSNLISIVAVFFSFLGFSVAYNAIFFSEPFTFIYILVGIYFILCLRVVFMFIGRKLRDEAKR